jgi:glycosyltransferase involved in cell wall biosynthesis
MKLLIAAVSGNTQLSGVTRHAANLARALLLHSDLEAIHLITGPWERSILRDAIALEDARLHIHSVFLDNTSVSRNLWYAFDLPSIARQLQVDLVHLGYPAPLRRPCLHCPAIVTVHDLYPWDFPANWGYPKVLFNRFILRHCLEAADAIACVSDSTFARLRQPPFSPFARKAVRIYNCVEPVRVRIGRSPLPQARDACFFLCVAQHRRNKNILLALSTFSRLLRENAIAPSTLLVVVGMPGPETPRLHRFIETSGLTSNVLLLSGISEAELQWCYRNCDALLAPSCLEGFGLPIVEALLAGCRVVCSDIPSFRELGGDHCTYFPLGLREEVAFAAAVRTALSRPRSSPVAFPRLSTEVIAAEAMTLYASVAARARSPLNPLPSPAERPAQTVP